MSMDRAETQKMFIEMMDGIRKAGGLFYQYRPCKINEDIIYDIENIRNGVVYARSPLYMNDPFDSMIGFSTEKLYEDFCSQILEMIPDQTTRIFMEMLLKNKAFGKTAEFISTLKELQNFLRLQRSKMRVSKGKLSEFAVWASKTIYPKMSPALRRKVGNINGFIAISVFTADIDLSAITEQNIMDMLKVDKAIIDMMDGFERTKNTVYLPALKDFLSRITISCFSASGWDNQLMWSHYTNSYAGICIEYDFTTINGETGIVYPVEYKAERPTMSLSDLGIQLVNMEHGLETKMVKTDIKSIFPYLLTKNECWKYEEEWRIINIGEPDTPRFINMPSIKSITLGLHIDEICKSLLLEVCQEKNIPCYELVPDIEKFALDRRLIDLKKGAFDIDKEIPYLQLLYNRISKILSGVGEVDCTKIFDHEANTVDIIQLISILEQLNDAYSYAYFAKRSINRIAKSSDDFSEEAIEKLKLLKTDIDMVNHLDIEPEKLNSALLFYKSSGTIDYISYKKARNLSVRINSVLEKIGAEQWNEKLLG